MSHFTDQMFKSLIELLPTIPILPESVVETVIAAKMKEYLGADSKVVDDFGWLFIAEMRHYL